MGHPPSDKKTVHGGAGITADGNVSIGDNTGQLAIGDFINQFKIEKLSGEELFKLMVLLDQKREESINKEILKTYSPSMLPKYPSHLKEFVTQNRAYELVHGLEYLQDHRILLISGIGGVGKTTLALALVETRPANVPLPFWFDHKSNMGATLGDILEKLAAYMNAPHIAQFKNEKRDAEPDDISRLTAELQKREPVWLIFDNLESILKDRCFHNPEMDLLFTSLRNSNHNAKVIITSRILPLLKNGDSLIDVIEDEKQELKGLKINFAVDYMAKNGLDGIDTTQLEELAAGVDGHPLALKLLVGLVKKFGAKVTLNDLSTFQRHKESTIKKARNLFDKLAGNEKELLERISVFRQSEPMHAIINMFTDTTSPDAVENLIDKSLLETDREGNFWLHPLVREFEYGDLEDKIKIHEIAMQYYLSLPLPKERTNKEDIQPLLEAHYHACRAEDYNNAFNIIMDNKLYMDLDRWGNYRTLIDLYLDLLPEDHFNDTSLLDNPQSHSIVLGNIGNAYRNLGQVEKALEYYEQALVISREIYDMRNEGVWIENLGIAYSDLGQVEKALEYYEQALMIAKEIGDRQGEGAALGTLGIAYSNLGQVEKALEYYEQALVISRKMGDRRGEGVWLGNLGNAYFNLGHLEKALEYHEQALVISRKVGDRRGEEEDLGNLGNAYINLGHLEKALEHYEKALVIAKEIGDRRGEGAGLGNLGIAYRNLGQVEKALEYYEQALVIAKEIGDRQGEGTYLENLGNAYSDLGQVEKALEYYEQALVITKEIDDRQGEGTYLGNLGNAYYLLGQVEKAIEYYQKALVIDLEIGDRRGEGAQLGKLGNAYSLLGQVEKALEYHKQALMIAKEIGDRQGEGTYLGNLGIEYRNLGQVEKAIEYYEQALVITKEIGDRQGEGTYLGNLGNAYLNLGQVEKTIEYYQKALVISRKIGDKRNEGNWLGNLGNAYFYQGQVEKAIEYHEQALVISKEIGDRRGKGAQLGNLGNAYSNLGQVEKAIEYYEQALVISKEIGDRRGEGAQLGNLGNAYSNLGQVEKAIEYYEQALVIGKKIKDPRLINFCEENLKSIKS